MGLVSFAPLACAAASRSSAWMSKRLPPPAIISRSCVSRYFATSQPRLSAPTRFSFGTATFSKNVSQNGDLPEMSTIGLVETPGVGMSMRRKEMPFCVTRLRGGAHEAEDPGGFVGVGGPDLLPVDEKVIATLLRFRAQRSEIGAGPRFRIALTPANFAAGNAWQVRRLLLGRAKFH